MCTLTDSILKGTTNARLLRQLQRLCPEAALVVASETIEGALALYGEGAGFVFIPRIHSAYHGGGPADGARGRPRGRADRRDEGAARAERGAGVSHTTNVLYTPRILAATVRKTGHGWAPVRAELDIRKGLGMAPRVFIVDDDGPVRKALGRLVQAAGYEVELFTSAEEYLAHEPAESPACLILDMRMPGMGGLELQRVVGGTPKSLPIVFVTGHGDDDARAQALGAGAVDVLQKPLDEEALLDAIGRALGRSRHP